MKIAGVQMDVVFGDREANLARIGERLRETASAGAQLTVFPECAVPGYCFDSLAEARGHAEPVPGPSTVRLAELCRECRVYAVVGLLEADGERLFNAAVLVGPAGVVGLYRKVHLPYLGVDRFTTPGDRPFAVHSADDVRVGMTICYDAAFPEAARVLALEGADLIALPTNWPPGAECTADYLINARALENNVYYIAVNRVGQERGFRFIGQSKICDPRGHVLAEARHTDEAVLYAEVDAAFARQKHIVRVPGKHEIDRFADRRPEMYGRIAEK
jgi:predicted amidohydrolase